MSSVPEISVEELKRRLDAGDDLVLVDVRSHGEHAIARLEPSILIPLPELPSRVDELEQDRELVVYCHHGVRSLSGAVILQRAGFPRVVSLRGGIDAWSLRVDPRVPRY